MNEFNYGKALEELESIAVKVEDPSTPIEDIDKYIKRADELVVKCREYLRSLRDKTEKL